jgi:peptide/nickel transport system substrate-binding protein
VVRLWITVAMLALGAGLLIASALVGPGARGSAGKIPTRGTLRVGLASDQFGTVDPAAVPFPETCGSLLRRSDGEPFRIVPEVASEFPAVSDGGRKFTFTLRPGFRFSDGSKVTPSNFKYALERILDPRRFDTHYASLFQDIVGADAIKQGRTRKLSGVRLVRPGYDLPVRMILVCAAERDLPVIPEGVPAPVVGAGPYYVSRYVPGHDLVFTRNRYYGGARRHHLERIHFFLDVAPDEIVPMIESGALDTGDLFGASDLGTTLPALKKKYGVNRSRFFVKPGFWISYFVFNMRAGIFHGNAGLRRAVNYALDRDAIVRAAGGFPFVNPGSSHYIPAGIAGRSRGHVYPQHHPELARARRLAAGHTGDGKVVLLVLPGFLEAGDMVEANLAALGLDVTVKPVGNVVGAMRNSWSGWDMGMTGWSYDYPDPNNGIDPLFHGGKQGTANFSGMDIARYNRMMDRAAAQPQGRRRWRSYARLERELMAKVAPIAVFRDVDRPILISRRVGCVSFTAWLRGAELDLATACLKR